MCNHLSIRPTVQCVEETSLMSGPEWRWQDSDRGRCYGYNSNWGFSLTVDMMQYTWSIKKITSPKKPWYREQTGHVTGRVAALHTYKSNNIILSSFWNQSEMDMGIFWSKFKEIYFPRYSGDLDTPEKTSNNDNLKDNNSRKKRLNSKRKVRLQIRYSTDILQFKCMKL